MMVAWLEQESSLVVASPGSVQLVSTASRLALWLLPCSVLVLPYLVCLGCHLRGRGRW